MPETATAAPSVVDPWTEFRVLARESTHGPTALAGEPVALACCDCGATAQLGGEGPLRFEHSEACRQPAQVRLAGESRSLLSD